MYRSAAEPRKPRLSPTELRLNTKKSPRRFFLIKDSVDENGRSHSPIRNPNGPERGADRAPGVGDREFRQGDDGPDAGGRHHAAACVPGARDAALVALHATGAAVFR